MKILAICKQCTWPKDESEGINYWITLGINDSNIYEYQCPLGHKNVLIIQQVEKFELLFESAIHAILDGYFREAVSNMASSLERLYEFSIKVILSKNKLTNKLFDQGWKHIKTQSERQLGAFIFLYLLEFKTMPPLPDEEKEVNFRNKIIHKGYFPNEKETMDYGEKTVQAMFEILLNLRGSCEENVKKVYDDEQIKKASKMTNDTIYSAEPTIFNVNRLVKEQFKPILLKDYIEELKNSNSWAHKHKNIIKST